MNVPNIPPPQAQSTSWGSTIWNVGCTLATPLTYTGSKVVSAGKSIGGWGAKQAVSLGAAKLVDWIPFSNAPIAFLIGTFITDPEQKKLASEAISKILNGDPKTKTALLQAVAPLMKLFENADFQKIISAIREGDIKVVIKELSTLDDAPEAKKLLNEVLSLLKPVLSSKVVQDSGLHAILGICTQDQVAQAAVKDKNVSAGIFGLLDAVIKLMDEAPSLFTALKNLSKTKWTSVDLLNAIETIKKDAGTNQTITSILTHLRAITQNEKVQGVFTQVINSQKLKGLIQLEDKNLEALVVELLPKAWDLYQNKEVEQALFDIASSALKFSDHPLVKHAIEEMKKGNWTHHSLAKEIQALKGDKDTNEAIIKLLKALQTIATHDKTKAVVEEAVSSAQPVIGKYLDPLFDKVIGDQDASSVENIKCLLGQVLPAKVWELYKDQEFSGKFFDIITSILTVIDNPALHDALEKVSKGKWSQAVIAHQIHVLKKDQASLTIAKILTDLQTLVTHQKTKAAVEALAKTPMAKDLAQRALQAKLSGWGMNADNSKTLLSVLPAKAWDLLNNQKAQIASGLKDMLLPLFVSLHNAELHTALSEISKDPMNLDLMANKINELGPETKRLVVEALTAFEKILSSKELEKALKELSKASLTREAAKEFLLPILRKYLNENTVNDKVVQEILFNLLPDQLWNIMTKKAGRARIKTLFDAVIGAFNEKNPEQIKEALIIVGTNAKELLNGNIEKVLEVAIKSMREGHKPFFAARKKYAGDLLDITGSHHRSEAARVTSRFSVDFINNAINNAETAEKGKWTEIFNDQTWGTALKTATKAHSEVIAEVIETNLSKAFVNFSTQPNAKDADFMPKLCTEILTSATAHFESLNNGKAAAKSEKEKEKERKAFFKSASERLLNILLPGGAKDLELPDFGFVDPKLKELFKGKELNVFAWDLIKENILPGILSNVFEEMLKPHNLRQMLISTIDNMTPKPGVVEGPKVPYKAPNDQVQKELGDAMGKLIKETINMFPRTMAYGALRPLTGSLGFTAISDNLMGAKVAEILREQFSKPNYLNEILAKSFTNGLKSWYTKGDWEGDKFSDNIKFTWPNTEQEKAEAGTTNAQNDNRSKVDLPVKLQAFTKNMLGNVVSGVTEASFGAVIGICLKIAFILGTLGISLLFKDSSVFFKDSSVSKFFDFVASGLAKVPMIALWIAGLITICLFVDIPRWFGWDWWNNHLKGQIAKGIAVLEDPLNEKLFQALTEGVIGALEKK